MHVPRFFYILLASLQTISFWGHVDYEMFEQELIIFDTYHQLDNTPYNFFAMNTIISGWTVPLARLEKVKRLPEH